jgi:colicin import membrane protein
MRETRDDTVIALFLSALIHAIPVALILLTLLWPARDTSNSAGEPVQADVVDMNALSASMRSALRRPPEPLAEPVEQPPPEEAMPEALEEQVEETPPEQQLKPQEQIPDPQDTQQEEVVDQAEAEQTAEREQEAKQKQGQRDLSENRETQEQIEQKRLTEMERQRQQQLADIRRQREQAQRDREHIEQRLDSLASQRAQQASDAVARQGNRGSETNLNAAYADAIAGAIRRNWIRPDNVQANQRCRIVIRQLPGGEVIDAQVDPSCPYDELGRRSVEAAVLKAQPLPYAGFESVFQRTLILNFQAEDR